MAHNKQQPTPMDELWRKAEARFQQLTGSSLHMKPAATLNACIEKIDKMGGTDDASGQDDDQGLQKAKELGIDTLYYIKLLGGVAAQAASNVFAPSSMCFNALAILLDIPGNVHKFHQAIAGMFETLGPSLSAFRVYERIENFKDVEPELNRAVHDLMISFVDICALSVQLRNGSKWRKFWKDAKAALLDKDSGVAGEIENFKRLTQAHATVQATQTLKVVLESDSHLKTILYQNAEIGRKTDIIVSDVAVLRASNDKRTFEDNKQKYLKVIKEKIGWDEVATKQSETTCERLLKDTMSGTGNWFKNKQDYAEFHTWAERNSQDSKPIFLVVGPQNTGKSIIMSNMRRHLQLTYTSPARLSPRTLIASYFFPSVAERREENPAKTALKSLAVQLAERDNAFAKALSQRCEKETDIDARIRDGSCQDLWDFLEIAEPKGNTVHYIVMDGLVSLQKEKADHFTQIWDILESVGPSKSSLRILISVRPDMISTEMSRISTNVDIVRANAADVREYVTQQLRKNDIFQDDDDDKRRQETEKRLTAKVGGDFNKINTVIEQINAVFDSNGPDTEVDRILDDSNDEKATSLSVINKLESKLNIGEIKELQELLRWIIYGEYTFWSLDELNGALFLKFGTKSIVRLQRKVEEGGKYSSILAFDEDKEVSVDEGIANLLQRKDRQFGATDNAPQITAKIEITKGDMKSIQSFCWDLSKKVAQISFDFDKAVEAGNVRESLQVNKIDSLISILRASFKILGNTPDKKTQGLGSYVLAYLPQHLEALEDTNTLDAQEIRDIGEGLYAVFESGDVVKRHWDVVDWVIWYRDAAEVTIMRRWLCNPNIRSKLGTKDRKWLEEVEKDSNPNQALLRPIMEMVARRWLQDTEWPVERLFEWLRGYLTMPSSDAPASVKQGEGQTVPNTENVDSPSQEINIGRVASWCKDVLQVRNEDSTWFQRLGETFSSQSQFDEAIKAFQKAIELKDPDPKLLHKLARAYADDEQHQEACQVLYQAIELFEKETELKKADLSSVYVDLGLWLSELDDPSEAITATKKAVDIEPENHEAQFRLLEIYLVNDRVEEAFNFAHGIFQTSGTNQSGVLSQVLERMLQPGVEDSLFLRLCSILQSQQTVLTRIINEISSIAERLTEDDDYARMASHFYKGLAAYYFCANNKPILRITALRSWQQCLDLAQEIRQTMSHPPQLAALAARLISAHHFEQSRNPEESTNLRAHFDRMAAMTSFATPSPFMPSAARVHIAAYHLIKNDAQSARASLRACMDSAFDILSDQDKDNDSLGYIYLATSLLHCGEDVDALSALSQRVPYPDKGNVMSWLLEFDGEDDDDLVRSLTSSLIATMEKECSERVALKPDQIDYVLHEIEKRLSEDTRQHDWIETDHQAQTSFEASNSNVPSGIENLLPERSEPASELSKAYAKIKARLEYWSDSITYIPTYSFCDGCGAAWNFENSMQACKFCYDVSFCQSCFRILQEGEPRRPQTVAALA
ncbi:uncharacterized protein JN550_003495 [Neoarthrinium moseri]|uniref:uncharacterized protein n=1 Tax=Neoarthrinium moseri TaxID=1658444 RepID=UPI001FDC8D3F|nr:uncharacterized protein JN550_003495 [Neoarthrinium moseri]KAI1873242.1 hypothetical protein JN550_003495 [Neoarthrinium moseri]